MKSLIFSLLIALCGFVASAQTPDELFTSKEYVKAAEAYSVVVKADPENVKALRRLAFCYMNIQNADALAYEYFEKALKVDPKDVASNYCLGLMYKKAAEKAEANKTANLKATAKRYLLTAADLGSEEAKAELKDL